MAGQVWYESINQWIALASAAVGLISAILAVVVSVHTISRLGEERRSRKREDERRDEEIRLLAEQLRLMREQTDSMKSNGESTKIQTDAFKVQADALGKQTEVLTKWVFDLEARISEELEALQAPITAGMAARQEEHAAAALQAKVESLRLSENEIVHAKRIVLRYRIQQAEARCDELKKLELDILGITSTFSVLENRSFRPFSVIGREHMTLFFDRLEDKIKSYMGRISKVQSLKPERNFYGELAEWRLRHDNPYQTWNQESEKACTKNLDELLRKHIGVKLLMERQVAEESLGALRREMGELESALDGLTPGSGADTATERAVSLAST
jgi:hypothetical protein